MARSIPFSYTHLDVYKRQRKTCLQKIWTRSKRALSTWRSTSKTLSLIHLYPTTACVAQKICELEGGAAAMLTGSGQAANYYAVFNICEAGDHVVLSSTVYGGTFNLLAVTMKKMGVSCTVVDLSLIHI